MLLLVAAAGVVRLCLIVREHGIECRASRPFRPHEKWMDNDDLEW